MLVKLDHLPTNRGENKQILELPPSNDNLTGIRVFCQKQSPNMSGTMETPTPQNGHFFDAVLAFLVPETFGETIT